MLWLLPFRCSLLTGCLSPFAFRPSSTQGPSFPPPLPAPLPPICWQPPTGLQVPLPAHLSFTLLLMETGFFHGITGNAFQGCMRCGRRRYCGESYGSETKTVPRCPLAWLHLPWKGVQPLSGRPTLVLTDPRRRARAQGCCAIIPSLA